jgi:hypothetical protein
MDLVSIGLIIWSRLLARRPAAPRWVRVVWLPLIVVPTGGFLASVAWLRYAFTSINTLPASEKATALANQISHAMSFVVVALAFDALVAVALGVYTYTGRAKA